MVYTSLAVRAAAYLALLCSVVTLAIVAANAPPPRVTGGGVVPTPDALAIRRDADRVPVRPSGFVGARITSTANQTSTGDALVFDKIGWDFGGWFSPDEPTRLTFPMYGICEVRVQLTVLGTLYHGAPASDVLVTIRRDGDPSAFVAGVRHSDSDPQVAGMVNAATTDWFEAGEYVEVFVTPGLLIESNWPGRANVSPVLSVTC